MKDKHFEKNNTVSLKETNNAGLYPTTKFNFLALSSCFHCYFRVFVSGKSEVHDHHFHRGPFP